MAQKIHLDEEKAQRFREIYPVMTNDDVSREIGITVWNIKKFAKEFGLEKSEDFWEICRERHAQKKLLNERKALGQKIPAHRCTETAHGTKTVIEKGGYTVTVHEMRG